MNRFSGNLAIGAATLFNLFSILYDDAGNALSFTFSLGLRYIGTGDFGTAIAPQRA